MGSKGNRRSKPKFERYTVVKPEEDAKLYHLLESIVERFHENSLGAVRFRLAWAADVKPDKDGILLLWSVKLPSKVDRQEHGIDAFVILNQNAWQNLVPAQEAILDEALCAIVRDTDKNGDFKEDAKGRPMLHVRKRPLSVFPENVKRHGFWQAEVERFVRDMAPRLPARAPDLIDHMEGRSEPRPGSPAPESVKSAIGALVPLTLCYRGFARTRPAVAGRALSEDEARAAISSVFKLAFSGNMPAARLKIGALAEAGWELQDPAALTIPAAAPPTGTNGTHPVTRDASAAGPVAPEPGAAEDAERKGVAPQTFCPQNVGQELRGRLAAAGLAFRGTAEAHGAVSETALELALNGYTAAKGKRNREKDALDALAALGWTRTPEGAPAALEAQAATTTAA